MSYAIGQVFYARGQAVPLVYSVYILEGVAHAITCLKALCSMLGSVLLLCAVAMLLGCDVPCPIGISEYSFIQRFSDYAPSLPCVVFVCPCLCDYMPLCLSCSLALARVI